MKTIPKEQFTVNQFANIMLEGWGDYHIYELIKLCEKTRRKQLIEYAYAIKYHYSEHEDDIVETGIQEIIELTK